MTAPPATASQTVNGNYGFATSKINLYPPGNAKNPAPDHQLPLYAPLTDNGYPEQDLPANDYIVSVDIPNDPVDGKPMYKVTSEEDVNVFDGDSYLPQQNFPPTTPAAANDPAGPPDATPVPPSQPPSQQAGIISPCVGALHTVDVTDPAFLAGGGSPFEGLDRPSCADKLVTVRSGQATAPNFNLFTDVPLPTHFWGLTLNDLGPDARQAQRQLRRGAGPAVRPGRAVRLVRAGWSTPRTPTSTACTRRSSRRRTRTTARCRRVRARTCTASSATTPANPAH